MYIEHSNINGVLKIRNAELADAPTLCRWWNDGAVMAHAGFPDGLGINLGKVELDLCRDHDDVFRRLLLELDGKPIGEMSCRNMGDKTAQIGIKICVTPEQGKGYGKLYLKMLIKELFSMGYVKITLDTNLKNERAQHVYEKLGFKKLRVNYDSWRDQRGALQSSVDYELLEQDFIGL